MTDKKLLSKKIRECQAGRAEGFAWLLDVYGDRLYGYFLRSCGSAVEAEDLVQELFLRLLEKIGSYQDVGKFESWLFRVAGNLVKDRGRRLSRQKVQTIGWGGDDEQGSWESSLAAEGGGPEVGLEQAESVAAMERALSSLPELDREMILMRHYGNLSFKEIAAEFKVPLGTALAKVHRGLKSLRKILVDDENE